MAHAARQPVSDHLAATAVNLADLDERTRLSPAAVRGMAKLADSWRLTNVAAAALLGGVSDRTWFRMKGGEWPGVLSQDELTRVSALLGIYRGLHLLFSDPLADDWVQAPNRGPTFAGRRPLDAMIEGGIPRMLEVRRHIDALRGGL